MQFLVDLISSIEERLVDGSSTTIPQEIYQ